MKNSTKILIGIVVVALVGAGVYFGGGDLFKGSLAPSSAKPAVTPVVSVPSSVSTKLNNGMVDIATFQITAPSNSAISFKKFAVKFQSSGDVNVESLDVVRKIGTTGAESTITGNVSIKNKAGQDLKASWSNFSVSDTDTIYVNWDKLAADQEFVSKGVTNTYIIRGTVTNASANEAIFTQVLTDIARPQKNNANALSKYNFIWSDLSAGDNHSTLTNDWFHGGSIPTLPTPIQTLVF